MTRERNRAARAAAAFAAEGPVGAARLVTYGFQPVHSRWTWQTRLPELWLRAYEGRRLREPFVGEKKES